MNEILQLIIQTLAVIISLAVFLWWIHRANKKDTEKNIEIIKAQTEKQLELKADKNVMAAELRVAHQKIIAQEIRLTEFEVRQSEQMKDFKGDLSYLRLKTDEIVKLIKK